MNEAVRVENLGKQYKNFKLKDITFSLPEGTITGLIGENGAGKTTIIKSILGVIHPDSGEVRIWDRELSEKDKDLREDIGVVFDDIKFYSDLRPDQIERIVRESYKNWDSKLYHKRLEEFKIDTGKKIKEMSRGMKMKLQIALALAHDPKLLIFDEATSGLDPVMREDLLEILYDFIQDEKHTILLSSHNLNDIERIADYVLFIHEGKLIFNKEKDDLKERMGIIRCQTEDFSGIDPEDIIAYRVSPNQYDVLIKDREKALKKYPELIIDRTSIDEIMLIYLKGIKNEEFVD